jgi:hypothetical protein
LNRRLLEALREVGSEPCARIYHTTSACDDGDLADLVYDGLATGPHASPHGNFWELTERGKLLYERDLEQRRRSA